MNTKIIKTSIGNYMLLTDLDLNKTIYKFRISTKS